MSPLSSRDRILNKICDNREDLLLRLERERQGKKVVFTNGCFDLLHSGHVLYLAAARELGDILVIGVNDDDSVRRLNKGPNRPLNPLRDRMTVLAALADVSYVFPFSEDTPESSIRVLRPDVHAKGGDYLEDELPEKDAVIEGGGRIAIIPFVSGYSTTSILKRALD